MSNKQSECPMCYAVQVIQAVGEKIYVTMVQRNMSLIDARDLASAYREHDGCTTRILEYPAIPYTQPYTPREVA